MAKSKRAVFRIAALGTALFFAACSSAGKKTTPELSRLHGKKVALVELDAEPTARSVVEVALVNQLTQRGTFEILSRQDVEKAREDTDLSPNDWKGIAKRAGADYALRAKVLDFNATEHEGYSKEVVEDSQLAEERGEDDAKTERVYKVKSLEGEVRVQLAFTSVSDGETKTGIAEAKNRVVAEAKTSAIHLPPRLSFLESLANDAFRKFFDQYN